MIFKYLTRDERIVIRVMLVNARPLNVGASCWSSKLARKLTLDGKGRVLEHSGLSAGDAADAEKRAASQPSAETSPHPSPSRR
jgi:hypothetical protein